MDAVKFIKARWRMYDYYLDCEECPLDKSNNDTGLRCDLYIQDNPEIAVDMIERWSKNHPERTRRMPPNSN